MSCYLRNKKYKKRLDAHVRISASRVEWTQKGRIAHSGRTNVRQRTRVNEPRVRYITLREKVEVSAPLRLRSNV